MLDTSLGVSLGGLVCRKLAMMRDLEFEIMSITTVGTPHHGSNLASVANAFTLGNDHLLTHRNYTMSLTFSSRFIATPFLPSIFFKYWRWPGTTRPYTKGDG